jgi:hypothetical protein
MFNIQSSPNRVLLPSLDSVLLIDDFLLDPDSFIDYAVRLESNFKKPIGNGFPGIELPLPNSCTMQFADRFRTTLRGYFGVRRVLSCFSRLSILSCQPSSLTPLQRVCHRDRYSISENEIAIAAVLYLFTNVELGGTAFYKSKLGPIQTETLMYQLSKSSNQECDALLGRPAEYLSESNLLFEKLLSIQPKFNRIIFYNGNIFHTSDILNPNLISSSPTSGRLTLNLFLICSKSSS